MIVRRQKEWQSPNCCMCGICILYRLPPSPSGQESPQPVEAPKRIDDVLHKEYIDNEEGQYSTDNEHRLLRGGYFRGREG
jgi:hypothetical protein